MTIHRNIGTHSAQRRTRAVVTSASACSNVSAFGRYGGEQQTVAPLATDVQVLPTREELRTWRNFIETTQALMTLLTGRLHTDTGLSPGDYAVLLTLSEATDHRVRSSELAARIGWERSRLSHHLGRMQRRQLIRREECATDSRGADVVLEPAGAEAFHAATVPHLRAIRELFVDALTADQLAAAGEIAAALQAHLSRPAATRRPESPTRTASAGTGSPTRHDTALSRTSTGHADTDRDSR